MDVEMISRLIHDDHAGLLSKRPRDRHSLSLTPRNPRKRRSCKIVDFHNLHRRVAQFEITSVHSWQDVPLHLQLPIAPVSGISICNMSQIPCWNVLSLRMDQTNGPLVTPTASNPHSVSVQVLHCSYLAATVGIDLALQFGLTDNSILF